MADRAQSFHATIVAAEFHDDDTFSMQFRQRRGEPPVEIGAGEYAVRPVPRESDRLEDETPEQRELDVVHDTLCAALGQNGERHGDTRAHAEKAAKLIATLRDDIARCLTFRDRCNELLAESGFVSAPLEDELGKAFEELKRLRAIESQPSAPQPAVTKAELREKIARTFAPLFRYAVSEAARDATRRACTAICELIDSLPDAPDEKPQRAYAVKLPLGGILMATSLRSLVVKIIAVTSSTPGDLGIEILWAEDDEIVLPCVVSPDRYSHEGEWLPVGEIAND